MRIAVTGHQCEKLQVSHRYLEKLFVSTFLEAKPEKVYVGMARGTDIIAGIAAIKTCFPVVACIPWEGHKASKYMQGCDECLSNYDFVVGFASEIQVLDPAVDYPGPQAFHNRNHYMVDNGTHVLSYWDGVKSRSGTWATVNYADQTEKPMRNLYGKTLSK